MDQLVIMQDKQAVTSSLKVAEDFGKRHDNVLREIEGLLKIEEARKYFSVATYEHEQNNQPYKMFYMNRDGFTLLAMGFTGRKAIQFKLKYINAFNEMEKVNAPRVLSKDEQLRASMRLSLETSEDVEILKEDVAELKDKVENQITLDHGEQRGLQKAISRKVFECAKSDDHKRLLYPELHREIKDRFGVTSYKDVKRQDLTAAIGYVNAWLPRKVS